jgi:ribosomal protein S12 methylthiotransferase accessory factor
MNAPDGLRLEASALRQSSSLRCRDPRETWEIAAPLMPAFGISRVTDITRLDRLGLPVFVGVRPRSLTVHVHAGKGVRAAEARIGALMESLELAVAEPAGSDWAAHRTTAMDMIEGWSGRLRLDDLALSLDARPAPGHAVVAVACEELGHAAPLHLPADLVFLPFEQAAGTRMFGCTSTGLASGNTLDEATLHALLEVLERDAVTMNTALDASCRVEPDALPAPFAEMARQWHDMGVALAVRWIPNDFDLPCFQACLHEPGSDTVNLAGGFGLHLDRDVAVARAICEAAQSRVGHIHGGRADVPEFYARCAPGNRAAREAADAEAVAARFDGARRIAFADVPQVACGERGVAELLEAVLARLRERGFGTVLRHRFAADLRGLHVVKVMVPRCEDFEPHTRRMGPRLKARVFGDA